MIFQVTMKWILKNSRNINQLLAPTVLRLLQVFFFFFLCACHIYLALILSFEFDFIGLAVLCSFYKLVCVGFYFVVGSNV